MVASPIRVDVTATSQADSSQRATVVLTVNPAAAVPPASLPHSVSLAWRGAGNANVVSYSVYRSTIAGVSYGLLASALGTASYDDQSVQSATTYYYVVTAVDDQGRESAFSNETRASVP
jgi:fibronectin type 3 domain-containing protein